MVKYVCNCFHALKVSFANEIGNICKALELDSHEVMNVFCADTKLNLSSYYLKPGVCVWRFVLAEGSARRHLQGEGARCRGSVVDPRSASRIDCKSRARWTWCCAPARSAVGILGFSFKAGTDDLRESPMVTLIETLIGKGLDLVIYDRDVSLARLFGSNKEYIEQGIPHIAKLMRASIDEVLSACGHDRDREQVGRVSPDRIAPASGPNRNRSGAPV